MTELEKAKENIKKFCENTILMTSKINSHLFRGRSKETVKAMFTDFEDVICDEAQTFMNLLAELRRTLTEEVERKEK